MFHVLLLYTNVHGEEKNEFGYSTLQITDHSGFNV